MSAQFVFANRITHSSNKTVEDLVRKIYFQDDEDCEEEMRHTSKRETRTIQVDLYQRCYVWSNNQGASFILKLLDGFPQHKIFIDYRDDQDCDYVVDGRQRLQTLWRFINDRFSIPFPKLDNTEGFSSYTFSQLPKNVQNKLLLSSLTVDYLRNWDEEAIYDQFVSLNESVPLTTAQKAKAIQCSVKEYTFGSELTHKFQEILKARNSPLAKVSDVFHDMMLRIMYITFCDEIEIVSKIPKIAKLLPTIKRDKEHEKQFDTVMKNLIEFFGVNGRCYVGKAELVSIVYFVYCNKDENVDWNDYGNHYDQNFVKPHKRGKRGNQTELCASYYKLMGASSTKARIESRHELLTKFFEEYKKPTINIAWDEDVNLDTPVSVVTLPKISKRSKTVSESTTKRAKQSSFVPQNRNPNDRLTTTPPDRVIYSRPRKITKISYVQ
jgi:hypothetical protein